MNPKNTAAKAKSKQTTNPPKPAKEKVRASSHLPGAFEEVYPTGRTPALTARLSGGQILFNTLHKLGVNTIFGYPGGAIMPIYDAMLEFDGKIKHILTRHEQGAVHAAQGFARVKNVPGVCFATSGPGATNLVTGIADAQADSVPLLCITGQVASPLLGSDAFQEADVIGITTPITKWNYQVTKAAEIEDTILKAYHIASTGRPGPVLVDITKDAQIELAAYQNKTLKSVNIPSYNPTLTPNINAIKKAAELINCAKKPLVFVGHGVLIANATAEVNTFLQITGAPVAVTMHGLSAIATSHPNYVGWLGMHGNYAPNMLTQAADVIVALGMRFDDRVTGRLKDYAPNAKIVHIDIDPAEINKNVKAYVPVVADCKAALKALIPHLSKANHELWLAKFKELYKLEYQKVIAQELIAKTYAIKMAQVINLLSQATNGHAIVVPDVGQHQMKTCRYFKFAKPNTLVTSGGMGTMGFALPAALGAQVGNTSKMPVIAVIGDGCFQMTIQELGTIVQENLPVKIVILNNSFLGMVRQWQELFFEKRYSFVHMQNPDFVAIAKGYGMQAQKVTSYKNLKASITQMLSVQGPYLLEVAVERQENVFPMMAPGASVGEIRLE